MRRITLLVDNDNLVAKVIEAVLPLVRAQITIDHDFGPTVLPHLPVDPAILDVLKVERDKVHKRRKRVQGGQPGPAREAILAAFAQGRRFTASDVRAIAIERGEDSKPYVNALHSLATAGRLDCDRTSKPFTYRIIKADPIPSPKKEVESA